MSSHFASHICPINLASRALIGSLLSGRWGGSAHMRVRQGPFSRRPCFAGTRMPGMGYFGRDRASLPSHTTLGFRPRTQARLRPSQHRSTHGSGRGERGLASAQVPLHLLRLYLSAANGRDQQENRSHVAALPLSAAFPSSHEKKGPKAVLRGFCRWRCSERCGWIRS